MAYIYACKTNGTCRQEYFESFGWVWSEKFPKYGHKRYYPDSLTDFSKYQCCTMCHLPLNAFIAMDVNKVLGNAKPSIDDLLASLDNLLGD
jgi:hypothetical protein